MKKYSGYVSEYRQVERHLCCPIEPRGVRGRNTEDEEIGKDVEVAEYQGKRHVVLKFIHEEKHMSFEPIGEGRRKREICDGVNVCISIVVY